MLTQMFSSAAQKKDDAPQYVLLGCGIACSDLTVSSSDCPRVYNARYYYYDPTDCPDSLYDEYLEWCDWFANHFVAWAGSDARELYLDSEPDYKGTLNFVAVYSSATPEKPDLTLEYIGKTTDSSSGSSVYAYRATDPDCKMYAYTGGGINWWYRQYEVSTLSLPAPTSNSGGPVQVEIPGWVDTGASE